jgi:hypothetical protein
MTQKANTVGGITLTAEEVAALREVLNDWMQEEIVTPPYKPEIASLISKAGLPAS